MSVRIINADVLDGLAQLPDESVSCCVTSPPYFGLRSYLPDDHPDKAKEIGLEKTPDEFIAKLVGVFREVRRVLRDDGVLFVNIGDSYNNFRSQMGPGQAVHGRDELRGKPDIKSRTRGIQGIKEKDLMGIPWMLAFALRSDGWYLRGDYIWHKPSCMPESVTDRCTKSHEYVFHLTKSASYFWDQEAIKEPAVTDDRERSSWDARKEAGEPIRRGDPGQSKHVTSTGTLASGLGRNKRSVWSINPKANPIAHFATMPPMLAETCIKAGSPKGGTVLDPFSGAGTTCLVADRLQRHGIGIELHPDYPGMAQSRIDGDRGGLLDIMEA